VLAVGLVFGQTVRYQFINFDDDEYVYENRQVSDGLSAEGIYWAFTHIHAGYWAPLTWFSLMLDCHLYGLNAGEHHLSNVVLHAATPILLFLLLWRMTGGLWSSALAAAIFAVHPLRVESVAWVTERKDVLSGLFFALTLGAYVSYVQHPFSAARYLATMVFLAFGLMAKPILVTLPLVLLLLDYWPLGRFASDSCLKPTPPHCNGGGVRGGAYSLQTSLRRLPILWQLVIEKLPLVLLAAIFCGITFWTQADGRVADETLPLGGRIANALVSYVAYPGQSVYPAGLAVFYPHPGDNLPIWKVLVAVAVLAMISAGVLACRRHCPYLLVGWLWYLGMLAPVIGLVQAGSQAKADRFTYLPQIGLCIALIWTATDLFHSWRFRHWAYGVASASALAVLIGCAWRQTSFWRDSETLWTHALACTLQNCAAHYNLGCALANRGRFDEAMTQYQKAVEIKPDYVDALNNLGAAFVRLGRFDEAMAQCRKALEIKPDLAEAHYNLGNALANRGRFDEAMAQYQKAVEIQPDYVEAHYNLGVALARLGRIDEAMTQYQKAVEIQPDYVEAHCNLGGVLAARSRLVEAVAQYRKALDLATQHNNQTLADALRATIARYETKKPSPQPPPTSVRLPPKP
jgi:tetratricopeptide (TPR) repeat protein